VYVYSHRLSDRQIHEAMLIPCASIQGTLASLLARYGQGARVCVLPDGPQTIPTAPSG
jgi:hypothetical protein